MMGDLSLLERRFGEGRREGRRWNAGFHFS
jgi:hypothetical protein